MLGQKTVRKIVIIGEPAVGKTALRRRFMGQGFDFNYMVTIGADFAIYRHSDKEIFQIWDLAGQDSFSLVREGYYKGAHGAIIVFDISRPDTFEKVADWIDEVQKNLKGQLIPFVLVGNKADLRESVGKWAVTEDEGKQYADQLSEWSGFDVPYIESSALTGLNVTNVFTDLIDEIKALESTL